MLCTHYPGNWGAFLIISVKQINISWSIDSSLSETESYTNATFHYSPEKMFQHWISECNRSVISLQFLCIPCWNTAIESEWEATMESKLKSCFFIWNWPSVRFDIPSLLMGTRVRNSDNFLYSLRQYRIGLRWYATGPFWHLWNRIQWIDRLTNTCPWPVQRSWKMLNEIVICKLLLWCATSYPITVSILSNANRI